METIQDIMKEIRDSADRLEKALLELHQPVFLIKDDEDVEQVEQEKAVDHYNDEKI